MNTYALVIKLFWLHCALFFLLLFLFSFCPLQPHRQKHTYLPLSKEQTGKQKDGGLHQGYQVFQDKPWTP